MNEGAKTGIRKEQTLEKWLAMNNLPEQLDEKDYSGEQWEIKLKTSI